MPAIGAIGLNALTGFVTADSHEPSDVKIAMDAAAGIVSGLVGWVFGKLGAAGPSWLSKRVIQGRYGTLFTSMPTAVPQVRAYWAINRDDHDLPGLGRVTGWGWRDTSTRLTAIRAVT